MNHPKPYKTIQLTANSTFPMTILVMNYQPKACCCHAAVPPVCDALSPLAPNGSCTAGWDTTEMVISWNIDEIFMEY